MGHLYFSNAEIEEEDLVAAVFRLSEKSRFSLYEDNEIFFLPGDPDEFAWQTSSSADEVSRVLRLALERESYFALHIYDSIFNVALICSVYAREFNTIVPVCMSHDDFETMTIGLLNELKLHVNKITFSNDFSDDEVIWTARNSRNQ